MARKDESILNLVARLPWRVGVCLAVGSFVFLRYILPIFFSGNPFLKNVAEFLAILSPIIGLVLLAAAGVSAFKSMERGQMLEEQKGLVTLKELSCPSNTRPHVSGAGTAVTSSSRRGRTGRAPGAVKRTLK